jgi:hypothetical protein
MARRVGSTQLGPDGARRFVTRGRRLADVESGRVALEAPSTKPLLDKLGVKLDSSVSVLGVDDDDFREQLRARVGGFAADRLAPESDLVFLGAESTDDLARLERVEDALKRNGAVWVVHPKGSRVVREADVLAAGLEVGLVDNKVVSFSGTHTAHRFVIPLARR